MPNTACVQTVVFVWRRAKEGAASRAIMPCRHLFLCADCEDIGLELCPICREEITDIVQVAVGDEDDYF